MKTKLFTILTFCLALPFLAAAQDLVPKPVKAEPKEGTFSFYPSVAVYCSKDVEALGYYLTDAVDKAQRGRVASSVTVAPYEYRRGAVHLNIDESLDLPAEGYRLTVDQDEVIIVGKDYGGVFNGIQTLFQLMPDRIYKGAAYDTPYFFGSGDFPLSAQCIYVEDYPRFAYRGMHLDVARTFSTVEDVLHFIENLSFHKINKFHWHLTDDEGWRIEIKSHPELARVGGFRGGDSPVMPIYGKWDEKYGGYFTQNDIRGIVTFAALRNIEIIPEIDLPGHSRTIALVHPEILCTGPAHTEASAGYDLRDVWCVAREENYEMLEDILREVCALFPSKYIHIGGDEVNFSQWNECPRCRALMAEESLADGHALEDYFMVRLEKVLAKYGKMPAVWNEAVKGGSMTRDVRVHAWEDVKVCKDVTARGYKTVIMPGRYFYFDMKYRAEEPGMAWAGIVGMPDVYGFDFEKEGFTPEQMKNVEGVQGAFWAELYLNQGDGTTSYLYRQTYPRVCALAEVGWTPQEMRQWEDFEGRLESAHYDRLAAMGIKYWTPQPIEKRAQIYPTVKFTSSMDMLERNPASNIDGYKHQARTTRTCREGDWLQFDFAQPVACSAMEFTTGYAYLARCLVTFGYAEVMYDGEKEYVRYGDLKAGKMTVEPAGRKIRSVRIVSTAERNGEASVIVQPVVVYK